MTRTPRALVASAALGLVATTGLVCAEPAVAAGTPGRSVPGISGGTRQTFALPLGGRFQIDGHGWGHGRGMSQHGALGAGGAGVTAERIVSTYYPSTARAVLPAGSIRVKLSADEGRDLVVAPAPGLTARDAATGASLALPGGAQAWRVLASGDLLLLQQQRNGTWSTVPVGGRPGLVGPVRFGGATVIRVSFPDGSARDYRGSVAAVRTGTNAIVSVNTLALEDYLRGVVPRESPASWNGAALQAQAIAARSYSAWKRAHASATSRYDICDSTMCQVYGGARLYPAGGRTPVSQEAASTDAAVRATAGVVRVYAGAPIFAEFSSSNGGWSTAGSVPYLVARADPWDGLTASSAHSWSAVLDAAALERRFPTLGTLRSLEVVARDGNGEWGGRVTSVLLHGDVAGRPTTVTTSGAGVYNARPWPSYRDGLRSTWWQVDAGLPGPPGGVTATAGDTTATVRWVPPSVVGGSALTGYQIVVAPGGRVVPVSPNRTSATVGDLPNGVRHTFTVRARNGGGYGASSPPSPAVTPQWRPGGYTALAATRLDDSVGPVPAGGSRRVAVLGRGGVPTAGVTSVVLTLTAVTPSAATWLSAWPADGRRPGTAAVVAPAGHTRSATVVVRPGVDGAVDLGVGAGATRTLVDVVGFHTSTGAGRLTAVPPTRLLDTRTSRGPLLAGHPLTVQVSGRAGVPAGATAVAVTVTGSSATAPTWVAARPARAAAATPPQLSVRPGATVSAFAVVPLSAAGQMQLVTRFGGLHVTVDVQGWYGRGTVAAGRVAASAPARLFRGSVSPGTPVAVTVAGTAGVPASGARAVLVSLTLAPGADRSAVAWTGGRLPDAVTASGGRALGGSGTAVVGLAADGTIRVASSAGTAVLAVDLLGWVSG